MLKFFVPCTSRTPSHVKPGREKVTPTHQMPSKVSTPDPPASDISKATSNRAARATSIQTCLSEGPQKLSRNRYPGRESTEATLLSSSRSQQASKPTSEQSLAARKPYKKLAA